MKFRYPPGAYSLSSSILRQGIVFAVLSFAGFEGPGSYGSISALSCVIGSLTAAARMLHALSRSGLAQSLAEVDDRHGTPARSIAMIGLVNLVYMMLWGAWFDDAMSYGGNIVTVRTLSLTLVYFSATAAQAVDAVSGRRRGWCIHVLACRDAASLAAVEQCVSRQSLARTSNGPTLLPRGSCSAR